MGFLPEDIDCALPIGAASVIETARDRHARNDEARCTQAAPLRKEFIGCLDLQKLCIYHAGNVPASSAAVLSDKLPGDLLIFLRACVTALSTVESRRYDPHERFDGDLTPSEGGEEVQEIRRAI
jgi:hypothetical protein